MNLDQLRYFSKLAETEHYGHASRELFISQPALSNSIKGLEAELGVALFERMGRNVKLTNRGVFFRQSVDEALSILDDAVEKLDAYRHGRMGLIRVASVESVQREFLPVLLSNFQKDIGKKVTFEVLRCSTFEAISALNKGLCDIAFCGMLPDSRRTSFVPLTMQNAIVAMNIDHPLASKETVSLNDLKGYPLVSYSPESYMHQVFKGVLDQYKLNFKQSFGDEMTAATIVSMSGDTIALILDTLGDVTFPYVSFKRVKELDKPFHTIAGAYIKDSKHPEIVDSLISFIEERRISGVPEPMEHIDLY